MVLSIAIVHLIRLIATLSMWDFLASLPGISPFYLAATGLIGALIGLPLAWGLWRGHPLARKALLVLTAIYAIYYWLERLALSASTDSLTNWPFSTFLTLALVITILGSLSLRDVKAFFGEVHE
jgi:hypothetical protein